MRKFLIRTVRELDIFLKHFNTKMFAFDTETTSLKYMDMSIEGISLCDGDIACYIVLKDKELPEASELLNKIEKLFSESEMLIGHNIVFDLKVLKTKNIVCEKPELYCTMVADHLIDENRRHGLKFLAKECLDKEDTESYSIASAGGVHTKQFYKYAINDAIWTWELMMYQVPLLKEQGLEKLFREIEMPFQRVLLDMETNGMLVDVEKVRTTRIKLRDTIDSIVEQMCNMLDIPYEIAINPEIYDSEFSIYPKVNFNSSDQVANILFNQLNLPIIETTSTGKPSVGSSVIDKLKSQHPFVELLYKLKKATKLYTSYFSEDAQIMSNIDKDNKVRPSFNDTGTATGRLSCSNPNLQQLPQNSKELNVDTREAFIASPGYKMIACDYSGQELRVLTQLTQEPALIDTFNKGKDMHLSTANDFFDLNIPEEDLYESSDKLEQWKTKFKSERNKAKIINFGMAYGKGAFGFSKDFGISEDEAQEILDKYFAALPKVKQSIEETHEKVRTEGFVASMTGRRRRFKPNDWGYYPSGAFRQSFNFLIQGFSADMIRIAMVRVRELSKRNPEWDLRVLATVHDEAVYEVKQEYAEVAAESIKQEFEQAVEFVIPVVADVSIGNNYSEAK